MLAFLGGSGVVIQLRRWPLRVACGLFVVDDCLDRYSSSLTVLALLLGLVLGFFLEGKWEVLTLTSLDVCCWTEPLGVLRWVLDLRYGRMCREMATCSNEEHRCIMLAHRCDL